MTAEIGVCHQVIQCDTEVLQADPVPDALVHVEIVPAGVGMIQGDDNCAALSQPTEGTERPTHSMAEQHDWVLSSGDIPLHRHFDPMKDRTVTEDGPFFAASGRIPDRDLSLWEGRLWSAKAPPARPSPP